MRSTLLFCLIFLSRELSFAQDGPAVPDSVRLLSEVVVEAYNARRPIAEVPATIAVVGPHQFDRFANTSILSAVNTMPGVRMEERSPGSYRFSIRGSLLRSPFGVRNVKFYWKGLPLTDGGGNTYVNLLDFSSVGKMEIIKGPGASLYGASTGGVVLLEPQAFKGKTQTDFSAVAGSYGLWRVQGGGNFVTSTKSTLTLRLSKQHSDGYRRQTAMDRTAAQFGWDYSINNRSSIAFTGFASHLYYQTPGGLTLAQFEEDSRQARPATPTLPGAEAQQAAVTNKTLYSGIIYENDWTDNWSTRIGFYGSATAFQNPAILNYEKRRETNLGGRTETTYQFDLNSSAKGRITMGGEYQLFVSPVQVYANNGGEAGVLSYDDDLTANSGIVFAQGEVNVARKIVATAGASLNLLRYDFTRVSTDPIITQQKKFAPRVFPRIAFLYRPIKSLSVYTTVSDGFSAPSFAEVRPSTGAFNNELKAEQGTNAEIGARSEWLGGKLMVELAAYEFRLRETIIVQRRPSDGADEFVNSGRTVQRGIEALLSFAPIRSTHNEWRIWSSYTYNDYTFRNYRINGNDFSGNPITGIAPVVLAVGTDLTVRGGWYAHVALNYTDHIPLNDAADVYAPAFTLIGARAGKKTKFGAATIDLFIGVDNALDVKYSLGNDLNAAFGRYYNAAPGRNFFGGLNIPIN
jgi:iron complex outermembrane receptor protein